MSLFDSLEIWWFVDFWKTSSLSTSMAPEVAEIKILNFSLSREEIKLN